MRITTVAAQIYKTELALRAALPRCFLAQSFCVMVSTSGRVQRYPTAAGFRSDCEQLLLIYCVTYCAQQQHTNSCILLLAKTLKLVSKCFTVSNDTINPPGSTSRLRQTKTLISLHVDIHFSMCMPGRGPSAMCMPGWGPSAMCMPGWGPSANNEVFGDGHRDDDDR